MGPAHHTPAGALLRPSSTGAWMRGISSKVDVCMQLLSSIYSNKVTSYLNGHDHAMAVGNPQQAGVPQA